MKRLILLIFIAVIFGWLLNDLTSYAVSFEPEKPFINFNLNGERISPTDWIKKSDIKQYPNEIIIKVKNARISSYANTNSMDPVLDENANGIEIVPKSFNDINIGDIIAYESEYGLIVHRVIEKNYDEKGIYFITKGDNNSKADPYKITFDKIRYVLIGIIY
ncbi:signal peptidase I [archaeon]|nr:signal peptidase I [archaeon]